MKIWLVMVGRYSDYNVHSAWSTEELAKEAVNKLKVEDANEGHDDSTYTASYFEIQLDKFQPILQNEKQLFRVWMDRDGKVTNLEVSEFAYAQYMDMDGKGPNAFKYLDHQKTKFYGTCAANDVEHAVKIINERRIQWLATNG